MRTPRIILVNWTPKALETIYWAFRATKHEIPDEIQWQALGEGTAGLRDFFRDMVKEKLGVPLEYVHTVWLLRNVSRAFQQQLTRHRVGFSYSIQSMRVVSKENFAIDGNFRAPEETHDNDLKYDYFVDTMQLLEERYEKMLSMGFTTEGARGVLPLNIYSTITFAATLRALINMMSSRLCTKVQGEFREVVELMKEEIAKKMDPVIAECIQPPCILEGRCQMRMENLQQIRGIDKREPCPRFVKTFGREG